MRADLFTYMVRVIVLFTAIPIHECAHGYVANKLGDDTAYHQGRITLNPFVHLDMMGTILLILTGFGWAKPVQVNTRRFEHPRRDMALTALAGPASNVLMALVLLIAYKVLWGFALAPAMRNTGSVVSVLIQMLWIMISVNLSLAVFNLLPVPPLDGSKIFGAVLPDKYYYFMMQYERYVFIVLLVLLYTGILSTPLSWLVRLLYWLLDLITYPVSLLAGFLY